MKLIALLALLAVSAAAQDGPCAVDGGAWYRHADLGGGVTRVTEVYTNYWLDTTIETPKGDVTRAQLQAYYHGLLADSALVFIARIDSVIQLGTGDDTSKPLTPYKTLAADTVRGRKYFRFYARIQVDTVLRGGLPGAPVSFWIEGRRVEACQFDWKHFKRAFFNASADFEKMSDLKIDLENGSLNYDRSAHWFNGRYLVTPPFYGIKLDITHVLPGYPATGIAPRGAPGRAFKAPPGKAWLPDGREAPFGEARKLAVPVMK